MPPFPIEFDPAAATSSRFAMTVTAASGMQDATFFLDLVAESTAMALRAVGVFSAMVDPVAVVRSRRTTTSPRDFEIEIEFDRPRPDLQRMVVNACASQGYDTDGMALFDRLRVTPRTGGPDAPPAMTLPNPPPYSMLDDDGAALTPADLPRKQNYTVYAGVLSGFDQRGEDLMLALTNISESGCLADPQAQPVDPDFTAPIVWPAYRDDDLDLPPRLGISRLCGTDFAVHVIAASIAVAALSPPDQLQLIFDENEY